MGWFWFFWFMGLIWGSSLSASEPIISSHASKNVDNVSAPGEDLETEIKSARQGEKPNLDALKWHNKNHEWKGDLRGDNSCLQPGEDLLIEHIPHKYMFVVVGGGTSGLAAAGMLSGYQDSFLPSPGGSNFRGRSVFVLERGKRKPAGLYEGYAERSELLQAKEYTETIVTEDGVLLKLPKVIGGKSTVNRNFVEARVTKYITDIATDVNIPNLDPIGLYSAELINNQITSYDIASIIPFGAAVGVTFTDRFGTYPGFDKDSAQKQESGGEKRTSEQYLIPPDENRDYDPVVVDIHTESEVEKILYHYIEGEDKLVAECVIYKTRATDTRVEEIIDAFVPNENKNPVKHNSLDGKDYHFREEISSDDAAKNAHIPEQGEKSFARRLKDSVKTKINSVLSYMQNLSKIFYVDHIVAKIDSSINPHPKQQKTVQKNSKKYEYKKVCVETSGPRKGVIVMAAGAVHTPGILMRSGIGPRAELEKNCIPVILDVPNLGRNLHDPVSISLNVPIKTGVEIKESVVSPRLSVELDLLNTVDYLPPGPSVEPNYIFYVNRPAGRSEVELLLYDQLYLEPEKRGTKGARNLNKLFSGCAVPDEDDGSRRRLENDFANTPGVGRRVLQEVKEVVDSIRGEPREGVEKLQEHRKKPDSFLKKEEGCVQIAEYISCVKDSVLFRSSLVNPQSRGKIHLGKTLQPIVDVKYLEKEEDLQRAVSLADILTHMAEDQNLDEYLIDNPKCNQLLGAIDVIAEELYFSSNTKSKTLPDITAGYLQHKVTSLYDERQQTLDHIFKQGSKPISYYPHYRSNRQKSKTLVKKHYTASHTPMGTALLGSVVDGNCNLIGGPANLLIVGSPLLQDIPPETNMHMSQILAIYCAIRTLIPV